MAPAGGQQGATRLPPCGLGWRSPGAKPSLRRPSKQSQEEVEARLLLGHHHPLGAGRRPALSLLLLGSVGPPAGGAPPPRSAGPDLLSKASTRLRVPSPKKKRSRPGGRATSSACTELLASEPRPPDRSWRRSPSSFRGPGSPPPIPITRAPSLVGWTAGASPARLGGGEVGRNSRRQGCLGSRAGPGTWLSPRSQDPYHGSFFRGDF